MLVAADQDAQFKNLLLLCWMRAVTIAMQITVIGLVQWALHSSLPLKPIGMILLAELCINLATFWRIRQLSAKQKQLWKYELFAHIAFDVLILALLIYYTGGAFNPFTGFFIVPVIVAATLLGSVQTWAIVLISTAAYLMISFAPANVVDHSMHHGGGQLFDAHRYGMFLGFLVSAILVAVFVSRIAANLRSRDRQLLKAQQLVEANHQINALGMLAAGAAHELGTPLNSLALINDELNRYTKQVPELKDLVNLHSKQVVRCKSSLEDLMSVSGESRAQGAGRQNLKDYLHNIANRWALAHPTVSIEINICIDDDRNCVVDKLFEKAIINLLDNAAKASPCYVGLSALIDKTMLVLDIDDKGEGISADVVRNLDQAIGMGARQYGFGLFWVKAFSLRARGYLYFETPDSGGTIAKLGIPVDEFSDG